MLLVLSIIYYLRHVNQYFQIEATILFTFYVLVKRRAGDLYPILKLERNARVLNRIKVELRVF